MRFTKLLLLASFLFSTMVITGCSTPRVVRSIVSTPEQIKFGYEQQELFLIFPTGSEQGIVRCELNEAQKPVNCVNLQLNFED